METYIYRINGNDKCQMQISGCLWRKRRWDTQSFQLLCNALFLYKKKSEPNMVHRAENKCIIILYNCLYILNIP